MKSSDLQKLTDEFLARGGKIKCENDFESQPYKIISLKPSRDRRNYPQGFQIEAIACKSNGSPVEKAAPIFILLLKIHNKQTLTAGQSYYFTLRSFNPTGSDKTRWRGKSTQITHIAEQAPTFIRKSDNINEKDESLHGLRPARR